VRCERPWSSPEVSSRSITLFPRLDGHEHAGKILLPLDFSLILLTTIQIMDGFESTAKIRDHERSYSLPRVNIAALTGVTSSEARARAKDAGVNVYVTKPIRMKDLTTMISDIRAGKPSTWLWTSGVLHSA
jgi:CheY-like chemotaxis protein